MHINSNPIGFVASMTSKAQNCYDMFIIHKKMKKIVILHKRLVFNFV